MLYSYDLFSSTALKFFGIPCCVVFCFPCRCMGVDVLTCPVTTVHDCASDAERSPLFHSFRCNTHHMPRPHAAVRVLQCSCMLQGWAAAGQSGLKGSEHEVARMRACTMTLGRVTLCQLALVAHDLCPPPTPSFSRPCSFPFTTRTNTARSATTARSSPETPHVRQRRGSPSSR